MPTAGHASLTAPPPFGRAQRLRTGRKEPLPPQIFNLSSCPFAPVTRSASNGAGFILSSRDSLRLMKRCYMLPTGGFSLLAAVPDLTVDDRKAQRHQPGSASEEYGHAFGAIGQ